MIALLRTSCCVTALLNDADWSGDGATGFGARSEQAETRSRSATAPANRAAARAGVEHAANELATTTSAAERAATDRAPAASPEEGAATTLARATTHEARPTPRPRRAATLPSRDDASPELRGRAAAAAAALARVDEAATPGVPLVVYERRLGDAEAAIAALEFGVAAADAAVHDFVEDTVSLHRTARDVRRLQLQMLAQSEVDRRGAGAATLPYFSDSKVPDWVAAEARCWVVYLASSSFL
jgi:hypothetical protein